MWALGITSKHTLNTYLKDAGVVKDEQIELVRLDPDGDVGKQVRTNIRDLRAMPVTFYTLNEDDGEKSRDVYNRQKIDRALAEGKTVFVEYQQANEHYVVDLPPAQEHERRPEKSGVSKEHKLKEGRARIKRTVPTPGVYPLEWTLNHLRYRYQLHFGRIASEELSITEIVEALSVDILVRSAESLGAKVRALS